jgi:hypothetical protein
MARGSFISDGKEFRLRRERVKYCPHGGAGWRDRRPCGGAAICRPVGETYPSRRRHAAAAPTSAAIPEQYGPPQGTYAAFPEPQGAAVPSKPSECQLQLAARATFKPLPVLSGPGECVATTRLPWTMFYCPITRKLCFRRRRRFAARWRRQWRHGCAKTWRPRRSSSARRCAASKITIPTNAAAAIAAQRNAQRARPRQRARYPRL